MGLVNFVSEILSLKISSCKISVGNERECTSENGIGQFSIFGAIEENILRKFPAILIAQTTASIRGLYRVTS